MDSQQLIFRMANDQMLVHVGLPCPHPIRERLEVFSALVDPGAQKTLVAPCIVDQGLLTKTETTGRFWYHQSLHYFESPEYRAILAIRHPHSCHDFTRRVVLHACLMQEEPSNYKVILGQDFLKFFDLEIKSRLNTFKLCPQIARPVRMRASCSLASSRAA